MTREVKVRVTKIDRGDSKVAKAIDENWKVGDTDKVSGISPGATGGMLGDKIGRIVRASKGRISKDTAMLMVAEDMYASGMGNSASRSRWYETPRRDSRDVRTRATGPGKCFATLGMLRTGRTVSWSRGQF